MGWAKGGHAWGRASFCPGQGDVSYVQDRPPRPVQSWDMQMHQAAWLGGYEWIEPREEPPRKGSGKQGERAWR
eukprot:2856710-Alexandrium_andersonii.AAC.1